jgi:hypothetical protein
VSSHGYSITASSPLPASTGSTYVERLEPTGSVQLTCTEFVGFDTGNMSLAGPVEYLTEWFSAGLARDVLIKSPTGDVAWHGYVNGMSLTVGDRTLTRSLNDWASRVVYVYTPLDTTEDPPVKGEQTTITKNDADTQDKYGIKTVIISGGEATAATADDDALSEIKKWAHIPYGEAVNVGGGKHPELKLDLLGYAHMVNWYVYSEIVLTGTANASTVILAILGDDPNSVVSSSAVNIDTNTLAVEQYQNNNKEAWGLIQDIARRGYETGGEGFPWTVGIYEGRRVVYKAAEGIDGNGNPEASNKYLALTRHAMDHADVFTDTAGAEVPVWKVRPDRLVYTGGVPMTAPMYVTQTTLTLPVTLRLQGRDATNPLRKRNSRVVPQNEREGLRSWFFAKDGDVTVQSGRKVVLGDGTEIPSSAIVPIGGIILWSGSVASIPAGWQLCNGTNGTPDLRNSFVIGAGDTYAVDATGGAATIDIQHNHEGNTGYESSHTHGHGSLSTDSDGHNHTLLATGSMLVAGGASYARLTDTQSHSHNVDSGSTGSGSSHRHTISNSLSTTQSVLNPYYALAFIQRLS